MVDVAQAQAEDPEVLREALLDQMAHLVQEVEALRTVVGRVPDQIKSGRPTADVLTMKELYGAFATLDAEIRPGLVSQVVEEEEPTLAPTDVDSAVREEGWNEKEMSTILDEVQEARRALVEDLRELNSEAWHRTASLDDQVLTLFELVHRMTENDAERLRDLGHRLHGAHLSDRDKPLPT